MNIKNILLYIVLCAYFCPISAWANDTNLSGTIVVVNKKADTVNFIDLKSGEIKFTRSTEKGPHELAISADGRIAVVTNYSGGNSLSVFDVQQAKLIKTIDLFRAC